MKKLFWNKWIGFLIIVFFSFSIFIGCVPETGEKTKKGAVIGAGIGALIGGTAGYIMDKAAKEAATTKKPVTYVSEDGIQKVYAKPIKSEGSCEWITVQYYEYGKLVKEEKKLICPN